MCRYLVAEAEEVAGPEHLPAWLGTNAEAKPAAKATLLKPLIERILEALAIAGGNKTKASEIVGISREHLQRVLRAHGGV
jgi:DNA-binding NtrC family response regulator